MVDSSEVEGAKRGAPGSAETEPGAGSLNPGGSQERGKRVEPLTMLTLEQLRRFGPRHVRIALELRWPSLKQGGGVVPWEGHAAGSTEGEA